ncbi:DEAD/DEAH box helicase [Thioalkalivibrio sp. ALJ7]|uniref:DEAD/DEAH box helicase n=1 Tax=Thioalkalivibrio sp. ALJ7 TaxID=1158756 RepID=UPI00037885C1|nr:DEAD/DEAH box helicase family protein [Thioalkalivibrio sp. ALJ7]
MTLFPYWQGDLVLPPLPERKTRIGGNLICQRPFRGARCRAKIESSQYKGHYLIRTGLPAPYDQILMRQKGARRVASTLPVLNAGQLSSLDNLTDRTVLFWDSLGDLEAYAVTPERVLALWRHKFTFRVENEEEQEPGLRMPQVGALHAISAHFAVGEQFEPATVVLPTGTGKTETMLATQVYRQLRRTLVLVPSDALRTQIFDKFVTLGVLPDAGVVPRELAGPHVAKITTGLRSIEECRSLVEKVNVIVALPDSLHSFEPEALAYLLDQCSDIIVDEAHHVTASTWAAVRDRFIDKRILQFTATPFRRDRKRVDGKIVFNYKLGDAQKAGYYRRINLRTVEEYGYESARDRAIAEQAVAVLRKDRDELGFDHLLMARTRNRDRADVVWALYQELAAELHPVIVYSGPGRRKTNAAALEKVLDRSAAGARIVVCVDMLGEGFDLPNLKIAALHDTHKSLAVTLQFIGRFTRKGATGAIGEATVVANIADPEAEAKLAALYAEGADWDVLIKRLSEERIHEELRLQDVVMGLKERGNLHDQLSLWNLRPALSTQIFRTKCTGWSPLNYAEVLPGGAESWYALDEENNLLVAVIHRTSTVDWGNYQNLENSVYELLLARWDKAAGALFIYASDYQGLRTERMARAITSDETEILSGPAVFRILNNVEMPLVKSMGSSRIGAISFTSYFGPNVTEGLADIEKREAQLNNIACLGYEDGERVLWGGTQRKGKIWQQKAGTISTWMEWCGRTWAKVASDVELDSNITRDFLRPQKLAASYEEYPVAVQWGEQAQMRFSDRQFMLFEDTEVPVFLVDLGIGSVREDGSIDIDITTDGLQSTYRLRISEDLPGGYSHEWVSGPRLKFAKANAEAVPLEEYLVTDPFIVRYADGTHSYNCYHIPILLEAGTYPKESLEAWDWAGIPLNRESMNRTGDQDTIQYRAFQHIEDEFDLIFNDDGHGEAADLVALKDTGDRIRLCLIHCKNAHGGRISADIRNFYTLCGQAQKSMAVKHGGLPRLYVDLKRRHETWSQQGASRFLKGDMKLLSYFKEKARRSQVDFEVVLVQPGATVDTVTPDILRLLATTELFLTKTTQAQFRVVVSGV